MALTVSDLLLDIPLPEDNEPPPAPPPPSLNSNATPEKSGKKRKKSAKTDGKKSHRVPSTGKDSLAPPPPPPTDAKPTYAKVIFTAPPEPPKTKEQEAQAALKVFDRDRKKFEATIFEIFNSAKPHSASKVHLVASLAVVQPTLYKVVEKVLAVLTEKSLVEEKYESFRTCIYLFDAIISAAQKKYAETEKFSGRFLPLILVRLEQFMQVKPDVSNKQAKKLESSLHRIKRECLRIVCKWLDKKRFSESHGLHALYAKWSRHFPELAALKTTSANMHAKPSPSKSLSERSSLPSSSFKMSSDFSVKKASIVGPPVTGDDNDLESRVLNLVRSGQISSAPVAAETPSTSKLPVPVVKLPLLSTPLLVLPPVPSPGDPSQNVTPTQVSTKMDFRKRFSAATAAPVEQPPGRFSRLSLDKRNAGGSRWNRSPSQGGSSGPSPVEFHHSPPALPDVRHVTASLLGLVPSMSMESMTPATMYPNVPLRMNPLAYLDRWKGFTPRPRPGHFSVVTSLLCLSSLPKDDDYETLENTVKHLFGRWGCVEWVIMKKKQRTAIVKMETRVQALVVRRKVAFTQEQTSNGEVKPLLPTGDGTKEVKEENEGGFGRSSGLWKEPAYDEKELALLKGARGNGPSKIPLDWYPTQFLRTDYVKYWDGGRHGVCYIPYTCCFSDTVSHHQTRPEFDIDRFKIFVEEIVRDKEAIIVPDSLPSAAARETYRTVTEPLFGCGDAKNC